jgi:hypothetical protein
LSAWDHDGHDREVDRELEDRAVETREEWLESVETDRMFRREDKGQGEEEE